MRMYDLILKKRNGMVFDKKEIDYIVQGYTRGEIPDYQISALLMAIFFQGLNEDETFLLTQSMVESGEKIDLSDIPGIKVDKHSTGGVGDKTTLVLAPLVASCGVPVAKMSGRGLGHTGGTIDKLESIPGIKVDLSMQKFIENVKKVGISISGQTGNLAPADKKFYALRDVTATVDNISLIASSIMSKKIAAGADAFVLDVKTGSGAFLKTIEDSIKLGRLMVDIGSKFNKQTVALITDMDQPLGYAIGNSLEVEEAINTLKDNGPEDLTNLCIELGAHMLLLAEKAENISEAKQVLRKKLENKEAYYKFLEMVECQGGDTEAVEKMQLPKAQIKQEITADSSGYISKMKADDIGRASMILGAGRQKKNDSIDLAAGILLNKKVGDKINKGDVIAWIYTNRQDAVSEAGDVLRNAIHIEKESSDKRPLILGMIDSRGQYTEY